AFRYRLSFPSRRSSDLQSDFLTDAVSIAPGQTGTIETMVFAGAKEVGKIQAYETQANIRQFDLLIDWGWFYFITKPMFYLIDWRSEEHTSELQSRENLV